MVLGGGYDSKGEEKRASGAIRNEADNGLKNQPYTIAMAREAELDSATRHFFFNLANNLQNQMLQMEPHVTVPKKLLYIVQEFSGRIVTE